MCKEKSNGDGDEEVNKERAIAHPVGAAESNLAAGIMLCWLRFQPFAHVGDCSFALRKGFRERKLRLNLVGAKAVIRRPVLQVQLGEAAAAYV